MHSSPSGDESFGTHPLSATDLATVLVPVKSFELAKGRLARVLDASARSSLARAMAEHVIRNASPAPVAVVCRDENVADIVRNLGARVLPDAGGGLNAAIRSAVFTLAEEGVTRVAIVHGDLPLARPFAPLLHGDGVTIVGDTRSDGTNMLVLPTGIGFEFAYGLGSFERHVRETRRLGQQLRIVTDPYLSLDIDTPADLRRVRRFLAGQIRSSQ